MLFHRGEDRTIIFHLVRIFWKELLELKITQLEATKISTMTLLLFVLLALLQEKMMNMIMYMSLSNLKCEFHAQSGNARHVLTTSNPNLSSHLMVNCITISLYILVKTDKELTIKVLTYFAS